MEAWMFAARTFIGFTAEGWLAIATFVGSGTVLISGAAVLYSFTQYLNEQEARDVRRYYIDEGLWAMSGSLDALIQTTLQNITTSGFLVDLIAKCPVGAPQAPRVEDLPKLAVMDWNEFTIRGERPARVILEFGHFDALAADAFGAIVLSHQEFLRVEQVVRTYYAAGKANEGLAEVLKSRVLVLSEEAKKFDDLPRVLEAAGVTLQKLRLSRFSQVDKIASEDEEIGRLKGKLSVLWNKVEASKAEDKDDRTVTES